jgi:hypothetical protein
MAGSSLRAFSSTPLSAWLKTTPAAASVVCGASGSVSDFCVREDDQNLTVTPLRRLQRASPVRLKQLQHLKLKTKYQQYNKKPKQIEGLFKQKMLYPTLAKILNIQNANDANDLTFAYHDASPARWSHLPSVRLFTTPRAKRATKKRLPKTPRVTISDRGRI